MTHYGTVYVSELLLNSHGDYKASLALLAIIAHLAIIDRLAVMTPFSPALVY